MKDKVAFVVIRYGQNMNGGAEQHCRMLAERLVTHYDVEILTTCVKDYVKGTNELPEGEEWIDDILVRRFPVAPIQPELHKEYERNAKVSRRLRKHLYQLGLLKFVASIHPKWTYNAEVEHKYMQSHPLYSPTLVSYVQNYKGKYKAIIPITMVYPPVYYAALYAAEKAILIPTMHYEGSTFRSIQTDVFTRVAYVGFNTTAEEQLAKNIFGNRMSPHGIISVGIEDSVDADWKVTKEKYNLPEEYLLFVGRIDKGKLDHIIQYYLDYKKKYSGSSLKLVLVGGLFSETFRHPDIFYTGFVSETEKYAIIQHAKVFVNPSKFESLSLILLEGMSRGKAMLENGKSAVFKKHRIKSDGAAFYYKGKRDFISKLNRIESSDELRVEMGRKGREYVAANYNWKIIMDRLKKAIEAI